MTNDTIDKDCGKRIRIAISLCGMKLPAFGKKYKISLSHLYAIEKGQRPLNVKIAERISNGVQQEGYFCTVNWLLNGEGNSPLKEEIQQEAFNKGTPMLSSLSPEIKVMKETAFFLSLYDNSIASCILDDGMFPLYSVGDYVGGIMSRDLVTTIGKDCIVTTDEDEQLIRRLFKGSKKGLYTLACLNPLTKAVPPIIFDNAIKTAAPIIWHRRRHY